jgi:hypothetical protein
MPSISVAGTLAAHEIAARVVLADPAAAAIAVVVVTVVAGGDRGADDGGAEEANFDAQPQPYGLASAWVVVVAIVPVTASAARGNSSNPGLIDMGNSIRLRRHRCGPHVPWTEFSRTGAIVFPEFQCLDIG